MKKKVLVIVLPEDDSYFKKWDQLNATLSEMGLRCEVLPGNLLASFGAEVGSVFGHYTGDPKGDQVELKIVAIPDSLEGEQIEKGKEYHILILGEK